MLSRHPLRPSTPATLRRLGATALLAAGVAGCRSEPVERVRMAWRARGVGAVPLLDTARLDAGARAPAAEVIRDLRAAAGDPAEYYVGVSRPPGDSLVVFHLWHRDLFRTENQGRDGDPSGRSYDAVYDLRRRRIVAHHGWA